MSDRSHHHCDGCDTLAECVLIGGEWYCTTCRNVRSSEPVRLDDASWSEGGE